MHNINCGQNYPKNVSKKLPKVNNHPTPNLVTLMRTDLIFFNSKEILADTNCQNFWLKPFHKNRLQTGIPRPPQTIIQTSAVAATRGRSLKTSARRKFGSNEGLLQPARGSIIKDERPSMMPAQRGSARGHPGEFAR
jgi:hypothetical protein